jgi:hypothetical protein
MKMNHYKTMFTVIILMEMAILTWAGIHLSPQLHYYPLAIGFLILAGATMTGSWIRYLRQAPLNKEQESTVLSLVITVGCLIFTVCWVLKG